MMSQNYEITNIQNLLTFERNFNIIGIYEVFFLLLKCTQGVSKYATLPQEYVLLYKINKTLL